MKIHNTIWQACILFMSVMWCGEVAAQTLIVDDDMKCVGATFTRIQDAIAAAAPNSIVAVCPGIYAEQLRIEKPITIRGEQVDDSNQAIIQPTQFVESSTVGDVTVAAVVFVNNATNVYINDLVVNGASNNIAACSPYLLGVLYLNASGSIQNSIVKNIKLFDSELAGCQSGVGIFVLSGDETSAGFSNVKIENNSLFDYQKAGIAANDAHTTVNIRGNTVKGNGAQDTNAQDGIQVAFGAHGSIYENTVSDHIYTPCIDYEQCAFAGKNIIVFESDGVKVAGNKLSRSQLNVRVTGDRNVIRDNVIFEAVTRDGIYVIGNYNAVISNKITKVSAAAIYVRGAKNVVAYNAIIDAQVGIQEVAPSKNNFFYDNTFTNTERETILISRVNERLLRGQQRVRRRFWSK